MKNRGHPINPTKKQLQKGTDREPLRPDPRKRDLNENPSPGKKKQKTTNSKQIINTMLNMIPKSFENPLTIHLASEAEIY